MNPSWHMLLLMAAALLAPLGHLHAAILQAEDYLYCPEAPPSDESTAALNKIISERRELARSISLEDFPGTMTFFGVRIDEPEILLKWRDQENDRVRALVPQNHLSKVLKFAEKVRDGTAAIEQKFPTRQSLDLGMSQSVERSSEQENLRVDLSVPTPCADYRLLNESEINEQGVLVIRVTLVRPSAYLLLNKEPSPTEAKTTVTHKGPLPKSLEIWTRTINDDLPLGLKYKRMGEAKLAGS